MRTFFLALLLACSQVGFAQHEYGIFNAYLGPCTVDSVNAGVDATAHLFAFRVSGVRDTIPEAVWLLDGLRNWGWHTPPFPKLNTNSTQCRTRDTLGWVFASDVDLVPNNMRQQAHVVTMQNSKINTSYCETTYSSIGGALHLGIGACAKDPPK